MRRWVAGAVVLVVVLALCGCHDDDRPSAVASTASSAASSAASVSTTTAPVTPTTASPLSFIAGCPDPGPLALPDANRPRYQATVNIDPPASAVTGSTTVTFVPDAAVDEMVFRLWANAPVPAASGSHMSIDAATMGASSDPLPTTLTDPTTLHVAVGGRASQSLTVTLAFTLTVPGNSNDRIAHAGDTMRLGSFLPLLAWEPGIGWAIEPATAIHGEAATSPVADYDVAVAVPPGYDVLGSGVRGPDDHWRATAVRDVGFSVGHFDIAEQDVSGVHVTVGVDRSVGEDPHHDLTLIANALPHYQSRLGAFPWPTYTVAMTPGLTGGVEFPLHVMQGPGSQDRSVVHELAHQWFYSLVGNNQGRDPWLDESLASYVEFVEIGSLERHANERIPGAVRGHTGDPMTFWENHASDYYQGLYVQGAVAIASLGTVDQVDCALRQYVAQNAFGIARPAEAFAALAVVFPDPVTALAPAGLHP
jgi:hypothetical protein